MNQRSGLRSSEFWLAVGTVAAGVLNKKLGLELDPMELASICGTVSVYIAGRGWTKVKGGGGSS